MAASIGIPRVEITKVPPRPQSPAMSRGKLAAILCFNIIQLLWNSWMAVGLLVRARQLDFALIGNLQKPRDPVIEMFMGLYLGNKVFDLIDIVIVVAKGKWFQLTFMQVYTHTTMVANAAVLYFGTAHGDVCVPMGINAGVHVLLFAHHTCALLRIPFLPRTALLVVQMLQFVFIMALSFQGYHCCSHQDESGWVYTLQLVLLLSFLFLYVDAYIESFSLWRTLYFWAVCLPVALLTPLVLFPIDLVLHTNYCTYLSMFILRHIAPFRIRENGNAPHDKCVIVCNHLSYFDATLVLMVQPHLRMAINANKYWMLPYIPALGWYMRTRGDLCIQGPDGFKQMSTWVAGTKRSCLIFPEARRSDQRPLPFHSGAFAIALAQNVPLLPMRLDNALSVGSRNGALYKECPPGAIMPQFTISWGRPVRMMPGRDPKETIKTLMEECRSWMMDARAPSPRSRLQQPPPYTSAFAAAAAAMPAYPPLARPLAPRAAVSPPYAMSAATYGGHPSFFFNEHFSVPPQRAPAAGDGGSGGGSGGGSLSGHVSGPGTYSAASPADIALFQQRQQQVLLLRQQQLQQQQQHQQPQQQQRHEATHNGNAHQFDFDSTLAARSNSTLLIM